MGTRENVHLPTSSLVLRLTRSSVLLHMIRSAPHLMSRNVPRQVMVSRSVVKFQRKAAFRCLGKNVAPCHSRVASMYPSSTANWSQRRTVRTSWSRNVSKDQRRCVRMFLGRTVSVCLYKKASRKKCVLDEAV